MNKLRTTGFTLIEVIIAIILSAIAMAAILPMLDRVFQLSHEPQQQLRDGLSLQAAMEDLVTWHTNGLEALKDHVDSEGVAGRYAVQYNGYVSFPGNVESPVVVSNNLLKVTIQNDLGETLTRLFPEPL